VLITHYFVGDKIQKNEMGGACSAYVRGERCDRVLVEKPEGKKPLGRPRCRWEYNIKIYLKEVGCRVMDWIDLAQDRDSWNEPSGSIKCGEFLD
jgi:hypothetical protein